MANPAIPTILNGSKFHLYPEVLHACFYVDGKVVVSNDPVGYFSQDVPPESIIKLLPNLLELNVNSF